MREQVLHAYISFKTIILQIDFRSVVNIVFQLVMNNMKKDVVLKYHEIVCIRYFFKLTF